MNYQSITQYFTRQNAFIAVSAAATAASVATGIEGFLEADPLKMLIGGPLSSITSLYALGLSFCIEENQTTLTDLLVANGFMYRTTKEEEEQQTGPVFAAKRYLCNSNEPIQATKFLR